MRRAAVALALVALSGACSDGSNGGEPAETTLAPPSTTTTVPTTTTTTALALPTVAADAVELGSTVADLERTIRRQPDGAASVALRQQYHYRVLAQRPDDWDRAFAAAGDQRPTVEANTRAQAELYALTKPRPALPEWTIVEPAPAAELLGYYKEAEAAVGVPWPYLAGIHLTETRMGRIRGTSTAGAQGPMQFLPSTWTQYGDGGDINDNRDAIFAAARLLKRNGAPADMRNALFNYNRSQRYVTAVVNYAERMAADEAAYFGYHGWEVFYRLESGDVLLPVGWPQVPEVS